MKYTYVYKTSEGVRCVDSMDALSRDEVFAALRARGIRPIKVVAADGSKANGEIRGVRKRVVTALVAASVLLTVVLVTFLDRKAPPPPPATMSPTLAEFSSEAESALMQYELSFSIGRVRDLEDYVAIYTNADISAYVELGRGADQVLARATKKLESAYAECEKKIDPADEEYRLAKSIYAEARLTVDKEYARLSNRRFIIELLHGNRGKWRIEKGRVVFSDPNLQKMFDYCREGVK